MLSDLDRYYTPPSVAREVVEATDATRMRSCVDSACGTGSLLRASEEVFPSVHCVGMDRDARAIRHLSREKPGWTLSRGDLLRKETWSNEAVLEQGQYCDYVLINPPFSMGRSKGVAACWKGRQLRTSLAMAHLLTTLSIFQPRKGGAAIVPESLVFSERDDEARRALSEDYTLIALRSLKNTTFSGTRANCTVLRLARKLSRRPVKGATPQVPSIPDIVRGGLPLFLAEPDRRGLPLIHSTAITLLARRRGDCSGLSRVRPIGRGAIQGNVVLLPRVGVPERAAVKAVRLPSAQLSDCVIALRFDTGAAAQAAARTIRESFPSFLRLYRGTGARYTTVKRLTEWLVDASLF